MSGGKLSTDEEQKARILLRIQVRGNCRMKMAVRSECLRLARLIESCATIDRFCDIHGRLPKPGDCYPYEVAAIMGAVSAKPANDLSHASPFKIV